MLSSHILSNVKQHLRGACARNIGIMAPMLQKATTDPIQQLFIDKLREYKQKSGSTNKLIEPSPDIQKELKWDLEKVTKQFSGGDGVDMIKFPQFKFVEPIIDPLNLELAAK